MAHEHHHGHDHGALAAAATAIDPVSEMVVDTATARSAELRGKTYYFCSEGCRTKFVADPDKYLNKSPFVLPPKKVATAPAAAPAQLHDHSHMEHSHPPASPVPPPHIGEG